MSQFIGRRTVGGLKGEAVGDRHDVAADPLRIGVVRQVTLRLGPPKPVARRRLIA
ncbi:hypothetical protein [Actinoplanes sp. NPDC048796]|uniref:hypothetical protein n=1 Tax=unclassified Actinoplanes TaxID=2626549 RepID=UPI0033F6D5D7